MKHKVVAATLALNAFALAGTAAHAQSINAQPVPQSVGHSYAGAVFGSPMAFGADWGSIGAGVYIAHLPDEFDGVEPEEDWDGSAALVFGLGDADEYVGLETAVVASSLTGAYGEDEFGEAGGLSFKVHTNLPGGAAVAMGVVGTSRWGEAEDQNESSVYAVGTKVFPIDTGSSRHALVVNLGLGDGQFNHDFDDDGVDVFGGLAFYFTRQISGIVDYTGPFLNIGGSFAPFNQFPVVFTLGAYNVTERFDSDVDFAGSVGYTFSF